MKVFCLYLVYGDVHIDTGYEELCNLNQRLFGNTGNFIIINNALDNDEEKVIDANTVLIAGDNNNREFSGWDKGFQYLSNELHPSQKDVIVLANDTFHRNYGNKYLQMFRRSNLQKAIELDGLAGYYDSYPEQINVFGLSLKFWLRTSILIGSYKSFLKLLPLSLPFSTDQIFSNDPNEFFKADVDLSQRYKCYLKGWLTNNYDGCGRFKESWHSQQRLNVENFTNLKDKARCIMSEHYLSARAQKMGMYFYIINRYSILKRIKGVVINLIKKLLKN